MNHFVNSLKRAGSLSSTDVGLFEQCNVLIKSFYRINSRRLSTRINEVIEKMSNALNTVQRFGSRVHGSVFGASVFGEKRERKWWWGVLCA